jgi:hypothetical protein
MKLVTFKGADAYLLDDEPDWVEAMELTAEVPTALTQGLSGLEDRRQQGDTLRLGLQFSATIEGEAIPALRNALQGLNVQPVLCPLWPAWFQPGEDPAVTGDWYVLCGDGQEASIEAAAGLPFDRPACPLMIGRLTDPPKPMALNDELATVGFAFQENDASYLTPAALALTNSLTAANGLRPLFPYRADWGTAPESGGSEQDIERRNIGQVRMMSDAYYAQIARRTATQTFRLEDGDAWGLLSFFLQMGSQRQNFWLPVSISEARLTADVAAVDAALQVDQPGTLGPNSLVVLDDLINRAGVRVTGVAGNTWNLAGAVGQAFAGADTRLESLMLARFDKTALTIKFSGALAEADIGFKEVPWEIAGASAETIGATMGPLPTTAALYVFTINYPGAAQTWRYTGFERDLVDVNGNGYASVGIERDEITETATIERGSLKFRLRNFAGNPMALMVPFALEWPLMLQVYEADVTLSVAGNLRCLFAGEVTQCDPDGPFLEGTAAALSYVFDRQIPRRLYQSGCNWAVYETRCGVARANWQYRGTVAGWNGGAMLLSLTGLVSMSDPINAAVIAEHAFAAGYLYAGAGAEVQCRMLSDSSAVAAGALQVALATAFATVPANGTFVYLYPGCDGTISKCQWFNNYANFGGFPFIPASNPTTNVLNPATSGGGKK